MSRQSCSVARIGLCTNDATLVALVERTLADEETQVVRLAHDADGQEYRVAPQPDVVLFDRATLSEIARRIRLARHRWPTTVIVVLNARDEADGARLLDEGADDVCVVRSTLLPSRLHAVARQARTLNADKRIAVGDVVLDRELRRVWCAGDEVSLSPREYDVLSCLVQYAPRVVGRQTLTEFVWGMETPARPNTVEVYVGYLRRKLARSHTVAIETVRRAGYLLAPLGAHPPAATAGVTLRATAAVSPVRNGRAGPPRGAHHIQRTGTGIR